MSDKTIDIRVSESASRLVGIATVDGVKTRYVEKSLADFDQDVVDVALSEPGATIRLMTAGTGDIAPSLNKLREARETIRTALADRESVVREAMESLETLGWSQKDAARVLGLSINMVRGMLAEDGPVHGSSVLGDEPSVLDGDDLVVGEWSVNGDEITTEACQIAGMSQRVRQMWAKAKGLDTSAKASSKKAKDSDAATVPAESESDGSQGESAMDSDGGQS